MRRILPLIIIIITVLLAATVWADQGKQEDSLPVYGMLGVIAPEVDSKGYNILVTEDGPRYSLVGVDATVEREISNIRKNQPSAPVKVWGTLYDSSDPAVSGSIIATKIEVNGEGATGGATPAIRVEVPTLNVRTGPSTSYPLVTQIREGEEYDIVGKSKGRRNWWYICCLSGKATEGWVSGDLVTVSGDTNDVPVVLVAPPPTPVPKPTPAPTPTPTGPVAPPSPGLGEWQVTYYNDIYLSGTPLGIRNESPQKYNLSRNWSLDSPWPGLVPADNWSGRYVSRWQFDGGDQYFELKSNDGAKLFLDNILIVDSWHDGDSWDNNYFRNLSGGVHTVTIEYYERGGLAWLEANWYKVSPGGHQPP